MNSPAKLTFSHQKHNFFQKIFASSIFLLIFADAYKKIVINPAG